MNSSLQSEQWIECDWQERGPASDRERTLAHGCRTRIRPRQAAQKQAANKKQEFTAEEIIR
jgi:hypothetical protein